MAPGERAVAETSPKIYSLEDAHLFLNWVAEGTDGNLYMVPSEPGGWRLRWRYRGEAQALTPISPEKAAAIADFVGGTCPEWGMVSIAGNCPADQPES